MKAHELASARPGTYVVRNLDDEVLTPALPQQEAGEEAARRTRAGEWCRTVDVLDIVERVVEVCMSQGCAAEVYIVCTPTGTLRLHDVGIPPGTVLRLCRPHWRELVDLARLQLMTLVQVNGGGSWV